MIKHLAETEDLKSLVKEGLYLVDFYAEWCGPCKMIAPLLENLKEIEVIKVDVDLHQPLAIEYGVMSVPTLIFFKNGQIVRKEIGFRSQEELEEIINQIK